MLTPCSLWSTSCARTWPSSTSGCRPRTRTKASAPPTASAPLELFGRDTRGVGYLLKDRVADVAELAAALRQVASGGSALDPDVVALLVGRADQHTTTLSGLTDREANVLRLMAQGRSNQAIGDRLGIAERTVEKHIANIFAKLGVPATADDHRRVLAVLSYLSR